MLIALVVVGVLCGWAGATLLLDVWSNHRAERLADRLRPYQPGSLADEAERWLSSQ